MFCRRSDSPGNCRRGRRQQRGAAMVVAMLVFAMAAVLVVAMKSNFQRFYQRASNVLFAEQAHAYLRGAEELAALVLIQDDDSDAQLPDPRDDQTEIWAQQPQPFPLDQGGMMTALPLEDLQGRFNLNSLSIPGQTPPRGSEARLTPFTPAQKQFVRLLQTFEEPQISEYDAKIITRSVIDWLDTDSSTSPDGAEDDVYGSRSPAYRAANGPMASVSELRAVANITPEIFAALAPLVTVWPQDPLNFPINIHTAKPEVLRSLNGEGDLTPLSDTEAEALVEVRDTVGFQDAEDFWKQPAFSGKEGIGTTKNLVGERSSHFLLVATVTLADKNTHLYSVLKRENRQVTALVRAGGSL